MITEEQKKILKETAEKVLEKLYIKGNVFIITDATPGDEESICIQIQSKDSSFLIGKFGGNLFALQHIIRIIVAKKTEERINFNVDVNSYVENQRENILDKATEAINEVEKTGKSRELEPMNGYERRLVHIQASKKSTVESESVGEGLERRVSIKPTE